MCIRTRFLILFLLSVCVRVDANQVNSFWIGGTGDWTDPTQWSAGGVPNNGANTYLVTVNSGGIDAANILTQNIYLNGISIGQQSTVNVNDQGLVLGSPVSVSTMLTNAGNISLTNAANLTLDYSAGAAATNSGKIAVGDESALYLTAPTGHNGTLTNTGTIALQNNPHGSQIYLSGDGGTFTFNGGGNLTLSDNAANLITGSLGTESLVSNNRIAGAGTITMLSNFANNGTILASGANPLVFNMDNGTARVTGTVTNNGSVQVAAGGSLVLQGSADLAFTNNGTISLNAQANHASVLLYNDNKTGSALHFSGPGTLSLSDNVNNIVSGVNGDETLMNEAAHTITGAGTISNFSFLDNHGTITASGANPLIVGISPMGELRNSGILQANDGSTLQFRSSGVTVDNEGLIALNAATATSTLSFDDSGAGAEFSITDPVTGGGRITLSDNPGNRIIGVNGTESLFLGPGQRLSGAGTISNFSFLDNHGTITANGANPLVLALSNTANPFGNLENAGVISVNDGSTLRITSGAWINNIGTINLNAGAHTSTLAFDNSQPILVGSSTVAGQLTMSDNAGNRIVGVTGQETLINNAAHTVQGAGTIANFGGGFVNNGVILANGVNPLIIDISAATSRGNAGVSTGGLMEVANGSTLQVLSSSGGNVLTTGSGEIFLASTATGTSTLSFNDQGRAGTFTLDSTTPGGSATVVLSIGGNRIVGVNGDERLINGAHSTIGGQGVIGNFAQFTNLGRLQTGGGVLEVAAPLGNWNGATATLTGGTYDVNGGMLKLDSLGAQTITNLSGAAITVQGGGILTGSGSTNGLSGLASVTNATVSLDGLTKPLTITPGVANTLTLTNSSVAVVRGASVSVNGSMAVDAGSILETLSGSRLFETGNLSVAAASSIVVGNGTSVAASDFINSGSLAVNAGSTATFKGAVSNAGTVIITAAGLLSVVRSPFLGFGTNVYTQTTGTTKVLSGGTLQAATLNLQGGTLGGGGNIAANVIVSGGTLAPGDPTTTNITGDLTMQDGGGIVLDIDGTGAGMFDALNISGNLHLDGGSLDVVFQNGLLPRPGNSWDLLIFAGAEDGPGFANITFENAGNLQFATFFNGRDFELTTEAPQAAPEPCTGPVMVALLLVVGIVRLRWARVCHHGHWVRKTL